MTESPVDPAQRIRAAFDETIADGLRADSVAGASDEEIDEMAASQGAAAVPAAVREVLRLVGRQHGLWLAGSTLGITLGDGAKSGALATISSLGDPLRDSTGSLVLVEHGAYTYHIIDGADLDSDNPAVWLVTEGEQVTRQWDSVTSWFEAISPDVERYRERLEIMRETGDDFLPAWVQYIDVG
ncbi:hypothetical protein [Actinophytocola sp.]|uniref:hypothetical protein n=1 Tax=Actinophytocola sp. TaxID=1872138 RepID=UPI002ED41330